MVNRSVQIHRTSLGENAFAGNVMLWARVRNVCGKTAARPRHNSISKRQWYTHREEDASACSSGVDWTVGSHESVSCCCDEVAKVAKG